jgi:secreted trypsin-like serine protease
MQTVMANGPKIINGELAVAYQFPFLVQLFNKTGSYYFCGGSMISPLHILTAAHCIYGASASELQIWGGGLSRDVGYKINVQAIFQHPYYNPDTLANDIAVIKIGSAFPQTYGIRSVKLPTVTAAVGVTLTATGFGSIVPGGGTYPDDLMYVDITVISSTQCSSYFSITAATMICAYDVNQGTCYGDSGGPLVAGSKTTATQHGVVSFVSANGCATAPSVFARVSYFRSWVVSKTVHGVVTTCANCALDTAWKGLCLQMGATFTHTTSNYQCTNIDLDKTKKVDYSWTGCGNAYVKNLCVNVGRWACVGGTTGRCVVF